MTPGTPCRHIAYVFKRPWTQFHTSGRVSRDVLFAIIDAMNNRIYRAITGDVLWNLQVACEEANQKELYLP